MTQKEIQDRILEIDKEMQQLLANYNALTGMKQDCLYWLDKLNSKGMPLETLKNVLGADSIEVVSSKE
jgi:hypothetical protein